ncbi:hypothetical protein Taro_039138 [Colocasia esculenta]|uniref:Hexosyltransferase n=1 Tax=Colocasia esculenta TaxID=4460 RepID=A0A843W8I6_COLES|nr:hypothetical protein [Colocasia esculenta]
MPSSPKFFYSRRSGASAGSTCLPRLRRLSSSPLFSLACLIFGLGGIIFGLVVASRAVASGSGCRDFEPNSVTVAWQRTGLGGEGGGGTLGGSDPRERRRVIGFVGIQTGFASIGRRKSLRKTWMPSTREGLRRLEEETGLAFRFVIGRTSDASKMAALTREVMEYDDFMLLDIEEQYSKLPYKTLAFFKAAYQLYDAQFYVKADDDIYLRPDRLSKLLAMERPHAQTYLGCMKKGPVFTDPKLKWYEPLSNLLGKEYFLHAYGPIYALSAEVVASLVVLRNNRERSSEEKSLRRCWGLPVACGRQVLASRRRRGLPLSGVHS